MAAVPGDAAAPDGHQALATIVQAVFLDRGLTLADPQTAEAFRASLRSVHLMLEGSCRAGILTGDQFAQLSGTLDAAHRAPELI